MWLGKHTPQDVFTSFGSHGIDITQYDTEKSPEVDKTFMRVKTGKTEKAKMLLQELGITVLDDPAGAQMAKAEKTLRGLNVDPTPTIQTTLGKILGVIKNKIKE